MPCTDWITVAPFPTDAAILFVELPVVTVPLIDVPFIVIGAEYALVIVKFPASLPCHNVK